MAVTIDLRNQTPAAAIPSGAVLFGAASASAATPAVYYASALPLSLQSFGVAGDGVTDDTAAVRMSLCKWWKKNC